MKGDHLSFARAAGVSLVGLLIQLACGLGLLIYSALGNDLSARAGAVLILVGSVVWLVLAMVFDQHRRERIEALEQDSLDATAARESSVFAQNPDELRPQARRLAWMHRVLVPGVSLALAVVMGAIGLWLYSLNAPRVPIDAFRDNHPVGAGWAISIGLGLGVIGFIFARYAGGMAQEKIWSLLRAGAAQSVTISLTGLALAAGHFALLAKADALLRYLQIGIPLATAVLGAEILLNFLLNLYRPRKPGEIPRAALESWLLGLVASPDRLARSLGGAITYQFGVDLSGSWLYRLLSRWVAVMAAVAILVVWLLTCLSVVGPGERGLHLRSGELVGEVGPGLHVKRPWPLDEIQKFPAQRLHELPLGTPRAPAEIGTLLWTNDHGKPEDEKRFIVQPAASLGTPRGASPVGTTDLALLSAEISVYYRIEDLTKYETFGPPEPDDASEAPGLSPKQDLLRAIARRELIAYAATLNEDQLLGAQRAGASVVLRERITRAFDRAGAGVRVVGVPIEGVHPPKETAESFEKVVGNQQLQQERIEKARQEEIETLTRAVGSVELARQISTRIDELNRLRQEPGNKDRVVTLEQEVDQLILQAGGSAGAKLAQARAQRWQTHMRARGAADAYAGRLIAYHANPLLYRANLYLQTLEGVMRESRLYLVHEQASPNINIDLKDSGTGGNIFDPAAAKSN